MVVYIDEVFAVNLLMDVLVLWAAGRLSMRELHWKRIVAAGSLGAFYGTVLFLPGCEWLANPLVKAICSVLMVWVGFGKGRWQGWVKTVVYLYLVSFAFGGGTVALTYFFGEHIVQTWSGIALVQVDFSLFWLAAAVLVLMVLVKLLAVPLHRHLEQTMPIVTVQAVLRDRSVSLRLLVDSGNCLTDPVTGKSVAVVQIEAIKALFTEDEFVQLTAGMLKDGIDVSGLALQLPSLASRIRLIPYQTVGYRGLMLGIRCDRLYIAAWDTEWRNAVLALSTQHFSADDVYQGIIAPAHEAGYQYDNRKGERI